MTHQHDAPTGPAPRRVRWAIGLVLAPLVVATVIGLVALWPDETPSPGAGFTGTPAFGTVTDLQQCNRDGCQTATVRLREGPDAPDDVQSVMPFGEQAPRVRVGDEVLLSYTEDAPPDQQYAFRDFDRTTPLTWLLVIFVAGVLLLSRWRGLGALASLAFSLGLLVVFTLPALTRGSPPLLVAVVTAAAIMVVTLYLSHGFSVRTSVAMIGTLVALTFTGVLGTLFTSAARFTGLGDEGSQYISAVNAEVDLTGLLLAGLVIGALGVLDDVTVTQAAAVWELADADPQASRGSLMVRGMRIGRAHVASTVNTLALAYVGATLPLFLVFSTIEVPFSAAVSLELVAQEIVRGLVGCLGILLAVPVTTGLAVVAAHGSAALVDNGSHSP